MCSDKFINLHRLTLYVCAIFSPLFAPTPTSYIYSQIYSTKFCAILISYGLFVNFFAGWWNLLHWLDTSGLIFTYMSQSQVFLIVTYWYCESIFHFISVVLFFSNGVPCVSHIHKLLGQNRWQYDYSRIIQIQHFNTFSNWKCGSEYITWCAGWENVSVMEK